MFCLIFQFPQKQSFFQVSSFRSLCLRADSKSMLVFQQINSSSPKYDRFIAIFSLQFIIDFSQVASQSSILRIILGHLLPTLRRKYRLTDVCNLFLILVVSFHVSHPYSSTDLTLLLNIVILVIIIFFSSTMSTS